MPMHLIGLSAPGAYLARNRWRLAKWGLACLSLVVGWSASSSLASFEGVSFQTWLVVIFEVVFKALGPGEPLSCGLDSSSDTQHRPVAAWHSSSEARDLVPLTDAGVIAALDLLLEVSCHCGVAIQSVVEPSIEWILDLLVDVAIQNTRSSQE